MTATSVPASPNSKWKRFWRFLVEIEQAISLGQEGWQDRRITHVEAELSAVKVKISALEEEREKRLRQ